MKKYLLLSSLILIGFLGIAQDNDAYKSFIRTTGVVIHKAQKEMLRSQKNDVGGLLAKTVILQNNAIALYKTKNNERAICASAVARKYAAEVIKTISNDTSSFYLIHDNEKNLLSNCVSDDVLYIESKQKANSASEKDADYITSLNNLTIDL
ncbi:MAG: hypothetical protein ABI448_06020 [Bacteroidia bacterium]